MLYQRPEIADAWHWARTSDDLAADPELDLWMADSLEAETSVGILVRDAMPADPAEAVDLVRTIPPAPWEVFPVPYRTARTVLTGLLEDPASIYRSLEADPPTAVRIRGEEITPLAARTRPDGRLAAAIRPGDLVMVDGTAAIFTPGPPDGSFSPPVVVTAAAEDPEAPGLAGRSRTVDVLHYPPAPRDGDLVFRLEAQPGYPQIAGISNTAATAALTQAGGPAGLSERDRRDCSSQPSAAARSTPAGQTRRSPGSPPAWSRSSAGRVADSDVDRPARRRDGLRVIVTDRRRAAAEEDLRQVLHPGG